VIDDMVGYFLSFFQSPSGLGTTYLAMAIGLAIGFGGVWLTCYWPPLFKKPWLWAVLVSSAFLTVAAVCFIQTPLNTWVLQALGHFWSQETLASWILLAVVPLVLLSGLVQEGAKLVPVVVYWRRSGKSLDPKLGLVIGAVAGAGFAIFEAQWTHNRIFADGWTWGAVQTYGFVALLGFWQKFFAVAAHIAFSALAGYGLAKGWGWQFYIIAVALDSLLNYASVLYNAQLLTNIQAIIYISVLPALVTAWALWLRWRRRTVAAEPAISSPEVMTAETGLPPGESSNQE